MNPVRVQFNRRRAAGLSLIESMFAVAILAVGTAAVCETVVSGHKATYEALRDARGQLLSEALMEEILSKPYADPEGLTTIGPDAGETARALYDNIDDYHGYTDGPTNIKDAAAAAYPSVYQGYTRSVAVAASSVTLSGIPATVTGVEITVTVSLNGRSWVLKRFAAEPESGTS